jgi:hypothetical protein
VAGVLDLFATDLLDVRQMALTSNWLASVQVCKICDTIDGDTILTGHPARFVPLTISHRCSQLSLQLWPMESR